MIIRNRISIATIYNDLHGFIRRSAHAESLKRLTYEHKASKAKTNAKKHKFLKNAIKHYTEALKLKFDSEVWAYTKRGNAYADIGDFDAAIEDYNKAIDLPPEYAFAYNSRGIAYLKEGDLCAAIEDFNKVIALAPEEAGFYYNRGMAWLYLKEWQKAKADLTTAKDMDFDIIEGFQNDYESVKTFEAKNGVKLPKDIAALLSGNTT